MPENLYLFPAWQCNSSCWKQFYMLFTQCLWWQNSKQRIVASLSAWSEAMQLSVRHWRWSEKKHSACAVDHWNFDVQGTCYFDVMHVCEPNKTTSSTFFKMLSTKSSSTYNAEPHNTWTLTSSKLAQWLLHHLLAHETVQVDWCILF